MSQFLQEIVPCSQTTSLFFNVSRMTFWLGVKPSPSATESESHFKTGDVLRVGRFEDDGYFCTIEVTATSTVTLDTLTEKHAEQENMTLTELKKVIADIYPDQTQFYVIEFKCL
ncbi:putative cytoplasmic protein [Escherichia coli]|nr:putative cytoplasmic protein [Escherichia coli]